MTTSANVTKCIIRRNGEIVGEHYQHCMCNTKWHRLYKYTPFIEHTIQSSWDDEDEVTHEYEEIGLSEFLANCPPKTSDMRRMIEHIEKQNEILEEWVEKFGEKDKPLCSKTLNSISYSPL